MWVTNPTNRNIKSIPLIKNWGDWLARNASIFKDSPSILEHIVVEILSILSHLPQEKEHVPIRHITKETVDTSRPWYFLMGYPKMILNSTKEGLLSTSPTCIFSTSKWDWGSGQTIWMK
jgi:hypothetical protein